MNKMPSENDVQKALNHSNVARGKVEEEIIFLSNQVTVRKIRTKKTSFQEVKCFATCDLIRADPRQWAKLPIFSLDSDCS